MSQPLLAWPHGVDLVRNAANRAHDSLRHRVDPVHPLRATCYLHWTFSRDLAIAVGRTGVVGFRVDLCPGCKSELTGDDDCLSRLESIFNHCHIALLALARFDWTQIDGVVRFNYENERPALADLHRLGRNQLRIFQNVENETHTHKFRRPESAIGIWRDGTRLDRAGAGLHRIVDEIKIAQPGRN